MRSAARGIGGWTLALVTVAALTACANASSGSRAELYETIDELAADSSVIVGGTVTGQFRDGSTTVSTVEVAHAPANPQLGANVDGDHAAVEVGDVVEVREDAAPLLAQGDEYLLFLTPTMLPDEAASQFFVTGAVAGIYRRDGDEFRRVALDSGDTLPETITVAGSGDG